MKKTFRVILMFLILPFLSACFVLMSAFLSTNIESYEEFENGKFGLPIPFIKQNLPKSGASGWEGTFPRRFELQLDFLDKNPETVFVKTNFILSVLIVYGIFPGVYFLILRKFIKFNI